jgi:hypothetical protein
MRHIRTFKLNDDSVGIVDITLQFLVRDSKTLEYWTKRIKSSTLLFVFSQVLVTFLLQPQAGLTNVLLHHLGNWIKMSDFTDTGSNWQSLPAYRPSVTNCACKSVLIRSDNVTDFRIKKLSIRELDPL